MKTIKLLTMAAVVLSIGIEVEARGWPQLRFWKKKEAVCVNQCVDVDQCVDSCLDSCVPIYEPACERGLRWTTVRSKIFVTPKHWLSKVCDRDYCVSDVHSPCVDQCVPDFCTDDYCVDDSCVDICRDRNPHRALAQLIYTAQTSCEPRARKRAIQRIGRHFDCGCDRDVMCVLTYALRDCNKYVRKEAAIQIGRQLRKNKCCCSANVIAALKCAHEDESRHVRRESARALRHCGVRVRRFAWLCNDSCVDGCVDGCIDDCVSCLAPTCNYPAELNDQWDAAPNDDAPAPKKILVDPAPKLKAPVKLPQLKKKQQKPSLPKAQNSKPLPAPGVAPETKKELYVPEQDTTSFVMPKSRIQKIVGFFK